MQSTYLGPHGLLSTEVNSDGLVTDDEPLIPDAGDVLPYLCLCDKHDIAISQILRATPYLQNGAYVRDGRIPAFFNHDWLIGLVEVFAFTHDDLVLRLACDAADTLWSRLRFNGVLLNENVNWRSWRSWLLRADPFTGGFIEPLVDLSQFANTDRYLAIAHEMGTTWVRRGAYDNRACFHRLSPFTVFGPPPVTLFKENTNLVFGLLRLWAATFDAEIRAGLERWLLGFEREFFNDGAVPLTNARPPCPANLKAAFASIDVLCDYMEGGIAVEKAHRLACRIADFWLGQQWENGLFPISVGVNQDHLDANTDIVVALSRLAVMSGNRAYREAAERCASSLLRLHASPYGYVLAVNPNNETVDDRIIVKYQALLVKLMLLSSGTWPSDASELRLLRDR